jgi:hypothetical protein
VLTYIWGPMINDWVNAQEEHLAECTNPLNCGWVFKTDEALGKSSKALLKKPWTTENIPNTWMPMTWARIFGLPELRGRKHPGSCS